MSTSAKSSPRNAWLATSAILASLFVMPMGAADNPSTTGLFELDGNAVASTTTPGDDWSTLFPTNTSSTVYNASFATDLPGSDTTYFSISSKDINDVSTWSATGNSAPDKDEITHAYAASYKTGATGQFSYLYFGADRYAQNGDASVGFWFLQNNVTISAAGAFVGTHARNDTLIVSDFTNGGAIGNVSVYRWEPSGTNHLILVAAGQDCTLVAANAPTCARVNSAGISAPWPYTPKQGASGTIPAQGFFEGGINLTAIYGSVPCFSNFLAETRSSQETTATLKDFVFTRFHNCPIVPPLSAFDLLKIEDADPVQLGDRVGFNITLANGGPDASFDTNISDPLPPLASAWTIDGVWQLPSLNVSSGCSITGSAPTQTLTCAFGSLAVFEGRAIHISAPSTVPGDCALQVNTAFLTTNNNASQSQNATADVTVLCPSLSIVKTADAASVSAGSPIGFTINVSNAGPGIARGVTLTDPLPVGSGISWSTSSAGCSVAASTLSCSFGDLAAGAFALAAVTSPTTFASCALYPNTASANATNHAVVNASANVTVLCPGLSIVKKADAASVSAGSDIGFTLWVNNSGPGTATGVTLTDPLPTGSGISWTDDSASCDVTAGTLSCSFGDLASGTGTSVHVTSPTTFASCAAYPNTASANATNHAAVNASANVTVLCPGLSLVKKADAASVSAGSDIGFTLWVNNSGPGTATGVTLNDPLPTGSGISWTDDSASCDVTAGTLSCSFGDLASGTSASVHVSSPTTFASCAAYPNTATANATNHAAVNATATTTVLCPDLDIVKIADATSVSAGSPIGFTIWVNNTGAGTATGVTLTDPLPTGSGISWSDDSASCDVTAGTLSCSFGDLASGTGASVHVSSPTTFASCAAYPNTATANATNHAAVNATATTTVLCPDLDIVKIADATSVSAGSPIGFTLWVNNTGSGTATGVTLNDPLPTGTGISWSDDSASCTIVSDVLSCSFGDLAPSTGASVHVSSPTTFASCAAYPNTATANATNHAAVNASATTTVLCPGLQIVKIADAPLVDAGQSIGFTLWVNNTGSGTATGVTLTDALPTGSGISWSDDSASCAVTAGVLTCSFGDLAPSTGASVHVSSPTTFASCATYPNTAYANATNAPVVNASASTTVQCPDLRITKTADAASVSAGSPIGFVITVSNAGPGAATSVGLVDPLPVGGGISWSDDSASCSIASDTLTCSFGTLANGASASVHVTSPTTLASCKAYPNTATATSTNHPNVTATNTTTVECPHMTLVKLADAASVSAGSPIGFGLWLNNTGNGTETNVTLNDPLPTGSGISWSVDVDSTGTACGIDISGALVCAYGDLPMGATRYVHVSSPTTFASCKAYPNVATAHNQETVNASATTTVLCPDLRISKTADAASVEAGGTIGFVITVSNAGPGVATGVTLTDPLPTGPGIAWSDDSASCSIASDTLSCAFGDLAASASASVHVTSPTNTTSCQAYPNTASANATNHATVNATASTTVTCPLNATRTQGFWQTHTAYTESVFDANLSGVMIVGTGGHTRTIDTYGKLFGAYYSSIPYKTTGAKRGQPDQARMTLLQQLVTAKLNCAAFGCSPATQSLIVAADAAYAGTDKSLMTTYTGLLDAYNNSGDGVPVGNTGNATPDASQAIANKVFWDTP